MKFRKTLCWVAMAFLPTTLASAIEKNAKPNSHRLELLDIFELEWASDPRISPDGTRVVYERNFMDIMKDRRRSNLWIIDIDGRNHRPLTTGNANHRSPRWSPDGKRLLYLSSDAVDRDGVQLWCRWMDTGQSARLTRLTSSPGGLAWSPDGEWIAFSMQVKTSPPSFVDAPEKPDGAKWADAPTVIQKLIYRYDGQGYLDAGFHHLFVIPSEGGTPRQLTSGEYHHRDTPGWTPDSKALVFSANREPDWEHLPFRSDLYEVAVDSGAMRRLTTLKGSASNPVVSPDGRHIAFVGHEDKQKSHHIDRLQVIERAAGVPTVLSGALDRSVYDPRWSADSTGLFFQFDDEGNSKIGHIALSGAIRTLAQNLGGGSIGRPYPGGSFSVARNGRIAFTETRSGYPADLAIGHENASSTRRLTHLNRDLLDHKRLARNQSFWYESSFDGRRIQGWLLTPPDFDPDRDPEKKYPLILEIHGGPFANYGDRFSAEMQLYAAAGYVVLYTNPRGSTSYGDAFAQLIHHRYPGEDYDDLLSGVNAVIERGFVDPERLFVTGGSGGGVLTSWIVGKTNRFRAAVAAKPVINWHSFVLTADAYSYFSRYWFPDFPWNDPEHYYKRSPLSLVGKVKTPTMLLTGEMDYRTPMSESEQFYQALKLRKIDTALVRIPGASHGIANRPSHLIAKVTHILKWFALHDKKTDAVGDK